MSLTDKEADLAFSSLTGALREAGFDWVTNQVEEKLAFGKVHARKLSAHEVPEPTLTFASDQESKRRSASKRTAVFAVSERFTPQERLGILLDGIDLAVPVVSEVAADVFTNLHEFGIEGVVEFAPEADVSAEFTLTAISIHQRISAATRLRELLNELRGELHGGH
jgi:hypothetical protein